jgi:hypothetical protein
MINQHYWIHGRPCLKYAIYIIQCHNFCSVFLLCCCLHWHQLWKGLSTSIIPWLHLLNPYLITVTVTGWYHTRCPMHFGHFWLFCIQSEFLSFLIRPPQLWLTTRPPRATPLLHNLWLSLSLILRSHIFQLTRAFVLLSVHKSIIFTWATEHHGLVVNTPSYVAGPEFKAWPRDRLSWLKFVVYLSPAKWMPGYNLKLGHDCFLPKPFQLIFHS